MTIHLTPDQARHIEQQALNRGYEDAGRYLIELVERDAHRKTGRYAQQSETDWAWQAIEQVAGSATGGLSTDEIMKTGRSEI